MEITPSIYVFKIPIPNNPLGSTNIYFIKSTQGNLLIDAGWNSEKSFQSLQDQMKEAGGAWEDLRYLALTHAHPDHSGLLDRVAEIAQPELILHALELELLTRANGDAKMVAKEMAGWLHSNGLPLPTQADPGFRMANFMGYTPGKLKERVVNGGERLRLGDFDFELVWTPGHAPGHLCLFEHSRGLLFAGDHILLFTTPNISKVNQIDGAASSPLNEYHSSLRKVAELPAKLVLPAHGPAFTQLKERAVEIEAHHKSRTQAILAVLDDEALTSFQISARIPWSTNGVPWEKLPFMLQQIAVAETLAHLDVLERQGKVKQASQDGIVRFTQAV